MKKEALLLAEWAKPLAHKYRAAPVVQPRPRTVDEFRRRYAAELRQQPEAWARSCASAPAMAW